MFQEFQDGKEQAYENREYFFFFFFDMTLKKRKL